MSFSPNFTAVQQYGNPAGIFFTDTSAGSDGAIVSRRIFILTANGTYLVQTGNSNTYSIWPLPLATPILLNVLTQDTSPSITVQYLDVSNTVLYSVTIPFSFTYNNENAYYTLTQNQTSDPTILQDTNYYMNKIRLRVNIDNANQAISWAGDTYTAQESLDMATQMTTNQNDYF